MISVHILTGQHKDQAFDFEKDALFIGRSDENDIKLVDRNVSRKHLKIFTEQGQYFIMDLGSKNGTYINDQQVAPNSKVMITETTPILIGMSILCVGKECKEYIKPYLDMVDIPESDKEVLRHSVLNYQQNIDLINKLSDILSDTATLSEMMVQILEIIFQVSAKINRAALILVDPETGDIGESVYKVRHPSDDTSSGYDMDVVSDVLKTNKPFQLLDAFDEYDDGISETLKIPKIRSIICLPLSDRSRTLGVLYIDSIKKPNLFQKEDIYLMKVLSEKISLHLGDFLPRHP
jgi:hypothetical protein